MDSDKLPCYLIERHTTVLHDTPTMGESRESYDEEAFGPFDTQREYDGQRRELMAGRRKEGWEVSAQVGITLERRGGGEISYFSRDTAREPEKNPWAFGCS